MARSVLGVAPARFAVVGLSLGGIVALHMALRAPERVVGLALIGANARAVPDDLHDSRRSEAAAARADLAAYARSTLAPLYAGTIAPSDPSFADLIADMAVAMGADALDAQSAAALGRPDLRQRLQDVAAVTAVIAGEEDRLGTPEMQRELAAGIPDASLLLVGGAGHLVTVEAPAAVETALRTWLTRVDAKAIVTGSPR
ncbi:alpha/beta fold hydrolase [Sphingomonas bacterium]|uniref:alpha/beta fold hydrolase n=1 Tax=Sphingomonas bacterium TaxID=1895847 RepID=UPI0020C5DAFD